MNDLHGVYHDGLFFANVTCEILVKLGGLPRSDLDVHLLHPSTLSPTTTHITMSTHSPHQPQNQLGFDPSTPPPPPPKPAYSSGHATPSAGPPRPPPLGQPTFASIPPPEHGWLPDIVKDTMLVALCLYSMTIF